MIILTVFAFELLHATDFYTDMSLAAEMYWYSRTDIHTDGKRFYNHYNISFIVIVMATFGPYIAQYSSYTNLLYQKGSYSEEQLKNASPWRKACLMVLLTVVGILIMPLLDVSIKIEAVINLLCIPLICSRKGKQPLN